MKLGIKFLLMSLFVGTTFVVAGYFMIQDSNIDSDWVRVDGEVIAIEESNSGDNDNTYSPIVQYQVGDQTFQIESSVGSSSKPTIGSIREVAYNPSNPEDSKVVEGIGTRMLIWLFPISGIALILLGPATFIWQKVKRNRVQSSNAEPFIPTLPPQTNSEN